MKAVLVLEDGFSLTGESFAGQGEVFGEVVFNTAMTGYQEMITDPSYRGQILTLTYPLIGNYGVNDDDVESASPQVEAFLIKEYCRRVYNRRATQTLGEYLESHGILGVEGIDTRTLTLHLRGAGTLKGVVSTGPASAAELLARVRAYAEQEAQDLVGRVSCAGEYAWHAGRESAFFTGSAGTAGTGSHVVVYDLGVKYSIPRRLAARGCRVTVVPAQTSASRVLALKPDGVLLSNGPGDPAALSSLLPEVRALLGRIPVFGICLGHQVLGLAVGLGTFKLPFGHRGGNHPVKELSTGRVSITSQNHGYCVHLEQEREGTRPTHINLNDGTLEGMENEKLGFFSIQFHPEASPGPHDSTRLFDRFIEMINRTRKEIR